MKNALLILFCLVGITACAQNKTSDMNENMKNDEAMVLTAVRQLAALMIARDTAAINHLLDEKYTLTHMTGYIQPKAEWFNEVQKESMKYYSAEEVSHSVTITGEKADVTMRNLVDARIWGSRNTWRLQQEMQLEKRHGKWIILKSTASTF